jgi:hypothetical protein
LAAEDQTGLTVDSTWDRYWEVAMFAAAVAIVVALMVL